MSELERFRAFVASSAGARAHLEQIDTDDSDAALASIADLARANGFELDEDALARELIRLATARARATDDGAEWQPGPALTEPPAGGKGAPLSDVVKTLIAWLRGTRS